MSIRVNHIRGTTTEIEGVTPQVAELGYDTVKKEPHIGDGATAGGLRLAKKNLKEILVAAQISATANDYNPTDLKHAGVVVVSTDAARDITGMVPTTVAGSTDGREIAVYNGGSFNATLKDQNAGSAAANRFDLGGADIVLAPKASVTLRYRAGALNRWELVASTAGAAVASGAVIARTLAASSMGFSLINGTIVASVGAGALTIAVKTLAGGDPSVSDPVHVLMRNATLATGDYVLRTLTAATSLVISSGSSMGASSASPFTLRLIGIDDAGTFRLGAINCGRLGASLPLLNTAQLVSSTAEGGAGLADNLYTVYTGVAVTSKAFAPIADLDWASGLTTAGTWDALPSQIHLVDRHVDPPGRGMPAIAKKFTGMFGGKIVESRAANAATFAVKTHAGNDPSATDPVYFSFQDAAGGFAVRTVTSALSLTIPSAQALGTSNSTPFRLWLVAIDTGTAVVLGIVNCRSGAAVLGLVDGVAYSSTAIAAAPSAQVIYSTAAQASKQITPIGYADYDAGLATAGTWNAAPSRLVLYTPATPRPGEPTGLRAQTATGASATGTTVMPNDDTLPQNTEGDQYMSQAITPSAIQNLLQVEATVPMSSSVANWLQAALFQDSGANALAAVATYQATPIGMVVNRILYRWLAGTVSATTFKIRAGGNSAGTTTFNGSSGGRIYAGVCNAVLDIQEIMG